MLKLNKEHFDLKEVISNAVDDYTNQIKNSNKNIRLVHSFDKKEDINQGGGEGSGEEQLHNKLQVQDNDTILVEADKGRIIQVIDNLLSNALKFTEKGTISVTVKGNDGQAVVSVKDNGQGINPSILPKLFTKFATSSSEGIGLGLFISKSIVEAHGGRIWAVGNMDGKGATFAFTIPCLIN